MTTSRYPSRKLDRCYCRENRHSFQLLVEYSGHAVLPLCPTIQVRIAPYPSLVDQ